MVCEDSTFIGSPHTSFLKQPLAEDDDVDFFLPADDTNDIMVQDLIYIISEEEEVEDLFDDASYVSDTYDEEDYYFSDDDVAEEDAYTIENESEIDEQIYDNTSDESNSSISVDKLTQATTQPGQNGTENRG